MEFFKSGNHRKFFLKDFRNAEHYKPSIAPPRQKFQGYVNFIINRRLMGMASDTKDFRTRISSLIRTSTLPEVQFTTEVKNSFNRKKIIQTGVELSDISMTVYDTIQNEWLTLFMKYYSYHYMNPRNKFNGTERDTAFMGGDTHGGYQKSNFGNQGDTPAKGYQWNSNDFGMDLGVTKNFFERIDIILYHGNKGVQYSLFNPMMKGFSASEIDYSSSEVMDFKLDFAYENFTTTNVYNFDLSEQDKARFERMEGVKLPGISNAEGQKPVALNDQKLEILNGKESAGRKRTHQPKTTGTNDENDRYMNTDVYFDGKSSILVSELDEDSLTNKIYTPSILAEDSGETKLDGISDFLENNPFGRIIDRGLSGAVNGQDLGDVLKGALTDEINYALTNPKGEPDLFTKVEKGSESDKQSESGNTESDDGSTSTASAYTPTVGF
tara:strand:- start:739 stop:2055 length:1317 start_codon:yes stop_codon:yes gene_type:complete